MEIKGDFTGFTFDGVKSTDLGIVRVSDGDRYTESLFGEMKDRTVEVAGVDGEYYFGTNFGNLPIKLSIAYDSVTEKQFRKIKQVFGQKKICDLIFDERPYKKYLVKVSSPIELSYVCFDEPKLIGQKEGTGVRRIVNELGERIWEPIVENVYDYSDTQRVYRGDGSIDLVAYFPFAKSTRQFLTNDDLDSDWAFSSGLLTEKQYRGYNVYTGIERKIYNPGDVETGIKIYCPADTLINGLTITYSPDDDAEVSTLKINGIETMQGNDIGILIDTSVGLIYGVTSFTPGVDGAPPTYSLNKTIYNLYVDAGFFFKIQPTEFEKQEELIYNNNEEKIININVPTQNATLMIDNDDENIVVYYDYLYM